MKRTHFTKSDHIDVGTELLAMDKQIHALAIKVSHAFGPNGPESKRAKKIRSELLRLRADLEMRLFMEFKSDSDPFLTHVYFGTDASRAHFGVIAKITPPL